MPTQKLEMSSFSYRMFTSSYRMGCPEISRVQINSLCHGIDSVCYILWYCGKVVVSTPAPQNSGHVGVSQPAPRNSGHVGVSQPAPFLAGRLGLSDPWPLHAGQVGVLWSRLSQSLPLLVHPVPLLQLLLLHYKTKCVKHWGMKTRGDPIPLALWTVKHACRVESPLTAHCTTALKNPFFILFFFDDIGISH